MLADLPPDQMLAVKLRRSVNGRGDNRTTDSSFFVYTGGLYPRGTANLTKLLDERAGVADVAGATADNDDADAAEDTDTAATSLQIDAKIAHQDSYGKSRVRHR